MMMMTMRIWMRQRTSVSKRNAIKNGFGAWPGGRGSGNVTASDDLILI